MVALSTAQKVAVVTGGTSGIGLSVATTLATRGFAVVATGRVAPGDTLPPGIRAVVVDHSDPDSSAQLAADITSHEGHITALVNNVGRRDNALIGEFDPSQLSETLALNVVSPLMTTSQLLHCFGPEGGSIVNITSRLASVGLVGVSAYAASKGALNSFTKAAAIELAPRNIRVNAVAPGMTRTPLIEGWLSEQPDPEQALATTLEGIPLGRLAETRDIAEVVAFLVSDEASYLTGMVLPVDGGYTAR